MILANRFRPTCTFQSETKSSVALKANSAGGVSSTKPAPTRRPVSGSVPYSTIRRASRTVASNWGRSDSMAISL